MQNEWSLLEPLKGLAGEWDKFVSPGQVLQEFLMIFIPSILAELLAPFYALKTHIDRVV
jgi:hypothetical protein